MLRHVAARLCAWGQRTRTPAVVARPQFIEAMEPRMLLAAATVWTGPANPSSVSEGTPTEPGQPIYFPINLENGDVMTNRLYVVEYELSGTATAGVDHSHPRFGSMEFPMSGFSQYASGSVPVTPRPDALIEPTETVIFTILRVTGGASGGDVRQPASTYGTSTATITDVPPPNQPPTIEGGGTITVNEHPSIPARVEGTYADPEGDPVSITATAGSVAMDVPEAGKWTWTHAALDGASTIGPVTLTADDGIPHDVPLNTTSVTVTVNNVAPTFTPAGPSQVFAGDLYRMLRPAVTDPGQDTISGWSVDWGDDTPASSYPADAEAFEHVYAGPAATRTITVTATDEDGSYARTTTVDVILPTVTVTSDDTTAHEGRPAEKGRLVFTRNGGIGVELVIRFRVANPAPPQPGIANAGDFMVPGAGAPGAPGGPDAGYMFHTTRFLPGQTEAFVDVTPEFDTLVEGDETATFTVADDPTAPDDYMPGAGSATVTIKDMPVVDSVTWVGFAHSDGATNFSEDNPVDMGGGFRLFPDKNTPTGPVHNQAQVYVQLNQAVATGQAVTVYLKVFDVDDPTAFQDEVDPHDVGAAGGYPAQYVGEDNREESWTVATSVGIAAGVTAAFVPCTFNGLRAGNNYRVFASTDQTVANAVQVDGNVRNGLTLDGQTRVNPFRIGSDSTNKPDVKYSSPVLAIWRKLYLEVDEMRMGQLPDNRHSGTVRSAWPNADPLGRTKLIVDPADPDFRADHQFENGWINLIGVPGVTGLVPVGDSYDRSTVGEGHVDVYVDDLTGAIAAGAAGKVFHLYDDDMGYDTGGNFAFNIGARIGDPNTSALAASLEDAFFVPVLDTTTSDAAIPFERNINYEDATGNEVVEVIDQDRQYAKTLVSDSYITAHLVSTFQGRPRADRDPNPDALAAEAAETYAVTAGSFVMGCLIHKEVLNDYGGADEAQVVVHEIAHLFERRAAGEDFHLHGGAMAPTAGPGATTIYAPATLERMRSRNFTNP